MFKKTELVKVSKYAIIPAVLYCIPVIFFLQEEQYTATWLLYLGNAIFLACLFILGANGYNKKKVRSVPYNGWMITIMGTIFSCILIFILLFVFAPGIFHIGSTQEVLQQTPAAISKKNSHGLIFMLFTSAIIGNIVAGTFATVITRGAFGKNHVPS